MFTPRIRMVYVRFIVVQLDIDYNDLMGYQWGVPLVNVYITMENQHAINGKTHYFDWVIFQFAMLNYQRVYSCKPRCSKKTVNLTMVSGPRVAKIDMEHLWQKHIEIIKMPSGNLTYLLIENGPFIVSFLIINGDFP